VLTCCPSISELNHQVSCPADLPVQLVILESLSLLLFPLTFTLCITLFLSSFGETAKDHGSQYRYPRDRIRIASCKEAQLIITVTNVRTNRNYCILSLKEPKIGRLDPSNKQFVTGAFDKDFSSVNGRIGTAKMRSIKQSCKCSEPQTMKQITRRSCHLFSESKNGNKACHRRKNDFDKSK
jgi:hypothetical protein